MVNNSFVVGDRTDRIEHPIIAIGPFQKLLGMGPVQVEAANEFDLTLQIELEFMFGCPDLSIFSKWDRNASLCETGVPSFSMVTDRLFRR